MENTPSRLPEQVDLLVIGGGINGVGIARDAAGRGLSVVLVERGDLAGATSSSSSKLIHGGLRYLEQFEIKLVAEALAEREILMKSAPHLVWPARFVMPHVPELRPRWMIRTGLFLYDNLGARMGVRSRLPGSTAIDLREPPYNAGLNGEFSNGFIYSDCRTDDARLVIAVARDAQARGALILPRTALLDAQRHAEHWSVRLENGRTLSARAIANVAGPWVKEVLNERLGVASNDSVRLVRGSHIVLPKLYEGEHAFILQNIDRRVVFMIPYQGDFTLVGTTDQEQGELTERPHATDAEVSYLCDAVGRYLARRPAETNVVWRYAGVRPLYDDGSGDPAAVTRDYTVRLDGEGALVASVFGGKLTTFRHLAEQVVNQLTEALARPAPGWTAAATLPGGEMGFGRFEAWLTDEIVPQFPWLPPHLLLTLARRHGTDLPALLGDAKGVAELGRDFGGGLYEREVAWMRTQEWARSAEDIVWRRTKCGLRMNSTQYAELESFLSGPQHG